MARDGIEIDDTVAAEFMKEAPEENTEASSTECLHGLIFHRQL